LSDPPGHRKIGAMHSTKRRTRLVVGSTWDGSPVATDERALLDLVLDDEALELFVEAPHHADPPPPGPAASHDGLWDFEVVELFLLGADDRYLEVELSPHGHFLVLELAGRRHVAKSGHPLVFEARIEGMRWKGRATIPIAWLPPGLDRVNAYAIHGEGDGRRHLAARPLGGNEPDFHRLDDFAPLVWKVEVDPG
jgi:hypothetical protein